MASRIWLQSYDFVDLCRQNRTRNTLLFTTQLFWSPAGLASVIFSIPVAFTAVILLLSFLEWGITNYKDEISRAS